MLNEVESCDIISLLNNKCLQIQAVVQDDFPEIPQQPAPGPAHRGRRRGRRRERVRGLGYQLRHVPYNVPQFEPNNVIEVNISF